MPHFRFARFFVFTLTAVVAGLVLYGQDAGMVLRTSVTYRTQRNTLQLTEEQRQQADQLAREAAQAGQAGKYGDAVRAYYHGLAVMRGVAWTPGYEFAASLQGHLDHAIVDPGKPVTVTLSPLYKSPATPAKLTASLFLVPLKKDGAAERSLATGIAVDPLATPFSTRVGLPPEAVGDYTIEVRLSPEGEPVGPAAPAGLVKALPVHIEPLAAPAERLRNRLAKTGVRSSPALPSAEYALALYERADRGEVNLAAYHLADDFAKANEILDALDAGRDPFGGRPGDFRKAYRSAVDHTLQPYRLFIPESYSASRPNALLIALHGMGGDENIMFDGYSGALKREAGRVGLVVACPKGRDSASMYRDSAEQDVLDVLTEVRRDYNIDPGRIYLMGHSMGGYGTWSIAMSHPDVFAALGPISGGGNPAGMVKIAQIPEYVVHGDDDRTVAITQSRAMVEAGKKAGANIVYVEVPGGSHTSVAAPQFGPMLDFFARQRKTVSQTAHLPRGTATDVTNDDIQATIKKTASAAVSDQAIRVVGINDEYNVGIGVVHRARTAGPAAGNGIEHSQITEIYHVMQGNATLVTGGVIENPRESSPESMVVKVLNGPSTGGGAVQGGVSRKVGPGDVIVIPPNTPHWFSEIASEQIVYLVVRVDPHKILPAGYGAK
jgi:predicted esterase